MLRRTSRVGAAALRRLAANDTALRRSARAQTRSMGFFSDLKNQLKAEMEKNEDIKKSFEEIEKTKEQIKNVEKAAKEKMQEVSSMTEEAAKNFQDQASAASQKLKDSYTSNTAQAGAGAEAGEKKEEETEASGEEQANGEEKSEQKAEDEGAAAYVKKLFAGINEKKDKLIKPKWKDEWRDAAKELFGGPEVSSVDEALSSVRTPSMPKPKTPVDGEEEEESAYTGSSALVAVKEDETAWQKVSARFREAPIIQGILDAAKQAARTEAGKKVSETASKAKNKIGDAKEDVLEFWETSQNPYVGFRMRL